MISWGSSDPGIRIKSWPGMSVYLSIAKPNLLTKALKPKPRGVRPYLVARAVPSGGGQPPVIVGKSALLRAGALFLMPNHHHQQDALLNLGLPPSNFRLRTAMVAILVILI